MAQLVPKLRVSVKALHQDGTSTQTGVREDNSQRNAGSLAQRIQAQGRTNPRTIQVLLHICESIMPLF